MLCSMEAESKKATDRDLVTLFQALADPTRLRLINLMRDGEVCVCFFVEVLGTNQPKISRHLAYLRRAGVVKARREGKWMHYRLVSPEDPHAAAVLKTVLDWGVQATTLQEDRARLISVCCAPAVPVRLQAAPRPTALPQT